MNARIVPELRLDVPPFGVIIVRTHPGGAGRETGMRISGPLNEEIPSGQIREVQRTMSLV